MNKGDFGEIRSNSSDRRMVFPPAVFSRDSVEMCVCVLKVRESKFRKSEVPTSEVEGIFIGKLYIN